MGEESSSDYLEVKKRGFYVSKHIKILNFQKSRRRFDGIKASLFGAKFYTNPTLFNIYNHMVRENALKTVVNITTLEVKTPSCPIFLAMT